MATAARKQDMPPPGGFRPINYERIPARAYFSGAEASRDLGFNFCKLELIFFSKRASTAQWAGIVDRINFVATLPITTTPSPVISPVVYIKLQNSILVYELLPRKITNIQHKESHGVIRNCPIRRLRIDTEEQNSSKWRPFFNLESRGVIPNCQIWIVLPEVLSKTDYALPQLSPEDTDCTSSAQEAAIAHPLINYKNEMRRRIEQRSSVHAIVPLLLAERDRAFLKQLRVNRDREAELMKNVEGWETGTLYGEPIYKTVSEDTLIEPRLREWYIHNSYGDAKKRLDLRFND
ncbi:GRIM-19 protein [Homalodisca vitripennis]|nr:GRIM-19 protein [Homalodisca vitripennis]